jgi:hypothetical protein
MWANEGAIFGLWQSRLRFALTGANAKRKRFDFTFRAHLRERET